MDGQIFLQYLFYGNWPFLLSSLQCLFDSSISISSSFQRNNYTNSLETYFVRALKKITWKYNKAPTAKTTPIASPRANITTKSVVKVRITFGSSPVP